MSLPRLDIDLEAITSNARTLVDRLTPKGIRVIGVTKASLGSPDVARAMLAGGVTGLGDSRVANLQRLRAAGVDAPMTLIRSPMLSQVDQVVRVADVSLNSEALVLDALSAAALAIGTTHGVVLMVELGDLREGLCGRQILDEARALGRRPGLRLVGLGTNLACQSGIVPDQAKMDELSDLVTEVERVCGTTLSVISGGNSANLAWALGPSDVGRVNELRLGEAILLGTEPQHRRPINGLRTDGFTLTAEVIEVQCKPAQPWGTVAQAADGPPVPRTGTGTVRQAILALGSQDVDADGLTLPPGVTLLGASSDHLVVDIHDHHIAVGDELAVGLGYGALVRAMTSPYVTKVTHSTRPH